MLHVTITEDFKVLLNEDYEAFICTGVNNDEGDARGFVRALETYKMEAMLESLLNIAEHYAKITVSIKEKEVAK